MTSSKQPKAAALRYKPNRDSAPRVVASGQGDLARKIIQLAINSQVPVYENPDLVEILSQLDLYQEIPPHCYRLVAEILHFVYHINELYKQEMAVPK